MDSKAPQRKAIDTDRIKLTRDLKARLGECLQRVGDHMIFRPPTGRYLPVEVYGSDQGAVVRPGRVAYALAHPTEHVGANEDVVILCEHLGDPSTGDGCCCNPAHLVKVPANTGGHVRETLRNAAEILGATDMQVAAA